MKLGIFLFILSISYSQNLIVHRSKSSGNKISQLEELIIKNTIDLYNKSEKNKITLNFMNHKSFSEMFNILEKYENEDTVHIVMNSITKTVEREKKYAFSSAYLPVKDVFISTKSNIVNWESNLRVGFMINSIQEGLIKDFNKAKYEFIGFNTYKNMQIALFEKSIDLMITDNVDAWNDESLFIQKELPKQIGSGYAIMFSKNSKMRNRIEKYFRYFLKSQKFKNTVYNLYGKDVASYFIKELRLM